MKFNFVKKLFLCRFVIPFSLRHEKCSSVPYPLFLNMKYPENFFSNLSIKKSLVTFAIILAVVLGALMAWLRKIIHDLRHKKSKQEEVKFPVK